MVGARSAPPAVISLERERGEGLRSAPCLSRQRLRCGDGYSTLRRDAQAQTNPRQVMMRRWQNIITVAAAFGILLLLTNMVLVERTRILQAEVSSRAQYIQQTVQLEGLQRDLLNAVANLSVRNKDDALKAILTDQGITIK